MEEAGIITVISNKQEVALNVNQILYVQMQGNFAFIHISKELVYQTRMTLTELAGKLGGNFNGLATAFTTTILWTSLCQSSTRHSSVT